MPSLQKLPSDENLPVPQPIERLRKRYFLRFATRIQTQTQNHGIAVDIINSVGIAYHQCGALYIIKPQENAR